MMKSVSRSILRSCHRDETGQTLVQRQQVVELRRRALREAFETEAAPIGGGRTLVQGFIVGVTNPKTVVFFAAILPQFADPSAGHTGLQMVVLGAVFAAIALAMDSVWGVAAGTVRSWFARSARRLDLVGGAAGLTMVGLGVGLAVTGRKE
jgi:threonine/homoserine/homoserine lactone efflux protein